MTSNISTGLSGVIVV